MVFSGFSLVFSGFPAVSNAPHRRSARWRPPWQRGVKLRGPNWCRMGRVSGVWGVGWIWLGLFFLFVGPGVWFVY